MNCDVDCVLVEEAGADDEMINVSLLLLINVLQDCSQIFTKAGADALHPHKYW